MLNLSAMTCRSVFCSIAAYVSYQEINDLEHGQVRFAVGMVTEQTGNDPQWDSPVKFELHGV